MARDAAWSGALEEKALQFDVKFFFCASINASREHRCAMKERLHKEKKLVCSSLLNF